jgi:tetratricopeptide (TPR) repeat protein
MEALALMQAGDRQAAKSAFARASNVISDAGSATHAVDGFEAVADVAEALAKSAEDEAERGELLGLLKQAHQAIWRVSTMGPNRSAIAHCFYYRGVEARLLGQTRKAKRCFEKSLELAERYSLVLGRARVLCELGRRDEARVIFAQAGASYEAARCTSDQPR